ncbi:hypothetical protein GCM10022212_28910 [Actimicrobium antarcticum]|uniref:Uncharacterized protein n=1 Tax=Actimicrobium antarcticum TaxID=1051899 RepID=A0ABP7TNN0_9BURK
MKNDVPGSDQACLYKAFAAGGNLVIWYCKQKYPGWLEQFKAVDGRTGSNHCNGLLRARYSAIQYVDNGSDVLALE